MKLKLFLIMFLFVNIFTISNTYAYYDVLDLRCTNDLKKELKDKATNVNYRISKNENDKYNLILYNLDNDIYVSDSNGYILQNPINNLEPGSKITLNFYASNLTYCAEYKLYTKTIAIPYYNKYYDNPMCNGHESFYLCTENTNTNNISEYEFTEKMNNYIKMLNTDSEEDPIIEPTNEKNYLFQYLHYLLLMVLLVTFVILEILIKKRKNEEKKYDVLYKKDIV